MSQSIVFRHDGILEFRESRSASGLSTRAAHLKVLERVISGSGGGEKRENNERRLRRLAEFMQRIGTHPLLALLWIKSPSAPSSSYNDVNSHIDQSSVPFEISYLSHSRSAVEALQRQYSEKVNVVVGNAVYDARRSTRS